MKPNPESARFETGLMNWIDELDFKTSARIEARLKRVAFGNFGDVKSIGQGI